MGSSLLPYALGGSSPTGECRRGSVHPFCVRLRRVATPSVDREREEVGMGSDRGSVTPRGRRCGIADPDHRGNLDVVVQACRQHERRVRAGLDTGNRRRHRDLRASVQQAR